MQSSTQRLNGRMGREREREKWQGKQQEMQGLQKLLSNLMLQPCLRLCMQALLFRRLWLLRVPRQQAETVLLPLHAIAPLLLQLHLPAVQQLLRLLR